MIPNSEPSPLHLEAIALARAGFRVFPLHSPTPAGGCSCGSAECENQGKHPRLGNWQRQATTDETIIAAWWSKWPDANIGGAMGDGVFAVDVDPRHQGDASLAALIRDRGPIGETLVSATGGGGDHYFFRPPVGVRIRNSSNKLGPGIDVRGEGGLVVLPPSMHVSGIQYAWAQFTRPGETAIALAPSWIVDALTAVPQLELEPKFSVEKSPAPAGQPREPTSAAPPPAAGVAYVKGERNDRMFRFACYLRDSSLSIGAICAALKVENRQRCRPPLSDVEVEQIARSSAKYQPSKDPTGAPLPQATAKPGATAPEPIQWLTLRERLKSYQTMGPKQPTGIEPLDKLLRGGLRPKKLLVFGGAPGAGKTTLARQIARGWAQTMVVGWLAIDEDTWSLDCRDLQSVGIPRDDAEVPSDETIELAEQALGGLNLWTVEDSTIEPFVAGLVLKAEGKDIALFVDSLQTVQCTAPEGDTRHEQISGLIRVIKSLAKRHSLRVVVTSELGRSAYRSRNASEQTDDMAAFKESGAIEYGVDAAVILRSVADCPNLVDATVPKARMGSKGAFRLELDRERAVFSPVASEAAAGSRADEFEAECRKVLEAIRATPRVGFRELRRVLGMSNDTLAATVERLTRDGAVRDDGKRRNGSPKVLVAIERQVEEEESNGDGDNLWGGIPGGL